MTSLQLLLRFLHSDIGVRHASNGSLSQEQAFRHTSCRVCLHTEEEDYGRLFSASELDLQPFEVMAQKKPFENYEAMLCAKKTGSVTVLNVGLQ